MRRAELGTNAADENDSFSFACCCFCCCCFTGSSSIQSAMHKDILKVVLIGDGGVGKANDSRSLYIYNINLPFSLFNRPVYGIRCITYTEYISYFRKHDVADMSPPSSMQFIHKRFTNAYKATIGKSDGNKKKTYLQDGQEPTSSPKKS